MPQVEEGSMGQGWDYFAEGQAYQQIHEAKWGSQGGSTRLLVGLAAVAGCAALCYAAVTLLRGKDQVASTTRLLSSDASSTTAPASSGTQLSGSSAPKVVIKASADGHCCDGCEVREASMRGVG